MSDSPQIRPTAEELDRLGHALSILVQHRYVWQFAHIARATLLSILDGPPRPELIAANYHFSREEEAAGAKPISANRILRHLVKGQAPFAQGNGDVFDGAWTREMTITGMRKGYILVAQAYLEFYNIESAFRRLQRSEVGLFVFIRSARHLLAHAGGVMSSARVVPGVWRHKEIKRNGETLKMTDRELDLLVQDAIEALAGVYVGGGREIDYVTLNLGFEVPYLRRYIDERKLGQ